MNRIATTINGHCTAHLHQKNGHTYVVAYDQQSVTDAILAVGRWAADPRLNFTTEDALEMEKAIGASV